MSASAPVHEGLRSFLAAELDDPALTLTDVRRHIEGFSWETWEMLAEWTREGSQHRQRLIARRVPEAGLVPPYDVPGQWELARALQDAPGVPVPAPLWVDPAGSATGRPLYLMEHVDGDVPVPWNTHTFFADAEARARLGRRLIEVLAAIHRVDLAALPAGLRGQADDDPAAEVWHWRSVYEGLGREPVPVLDRAFGWLAARAGDVSGRRTLVHGDFRIGNAIVRDGAVAAMLDWELAHIGDPVEDIANFCMRLYRGKSKIPGGVLEVDDVLSSYRLAGGHDVSTSQLRFWLVFGDVRSAVTFLLAADLFARERTRDLRYAAFSHQTPYLLRHVMIDLCADA